MSEAAGHTSLVRERNLQNTSFLLLRLMSFVVPLWSAHGKRQRCISIGFMCKPPLSNHGMPPRWSCFTLQSITVTCPVWAVYFHVYLLHDVFLVKLQACCFTVSLALFGLPLCCCRCCYFVTCPVWAATAFVDAVAATAAAAAAAQLLLLLWFIQHCLGGLLARFLLRASPPK